MQLLIEIGKINYLTKHGDSFQLLPLNKDQGIILKDKFLIAAYDNQKDLFVLSLKINLSFIRLKNLIELLNMINIRNCNSKLKIYVDKDIELSLNYYQDTNAEVREGIINGLY